MNMTSENIKKQFDELSKEAINANKYQIEADLLAARFIDIIIQQIETKNITRKELAKMIGTSASYITQVFSADKTINFITLAKIKDVLGIDFAISLKGSFEDSLNDEYLEKTIFCNSEGFWKLSKMPVVEVNKKYVEFNKEKIAV